MKMVMVEGKGCGGRRQRRSLQFIGCVCSSLHADLGG